MIDEPAAARLVEAFANTVDVELDTDTLSTPVGLHDWLLEHGLLDRPHRVGSDDHSRCLRLRDGIREELGANVGEMPDRAVLAGADAALRELPLLAQVRAPGATGRAEEALVPDPRLSPVSQALARLAAAWAQLTVTGEAARLKRCAEHNCAWVFWDVSKNRSRRWCSMRVCGNRAKARRRTARQSADRVSAAV
ncbi:CGNR zinc finger domain-containing protein [Streptomyces sp. TRM 70361]|uniref:CGNR zinc finger domain-containing protein n=1 Tax=Streptomyces sp. TRM 70361 TaxID=3116553 RepID=UPI002E7AEAA5|nr:CGNR zinc finger domain-containing protein [Streptomyces sp. TRM 70361]MEE1943022.1 CGNR zinc finger domain-containing protein [Streptomyces sp. TRM 70361]